MNNTQIATENRANLRFAGQANALNITDYDNQSLIGGVLTLPARGTNQTTSPRLQQDISRYQCQNMKAKCSQRVL